MADSKIIKVTLKTVADISDVQANAKEIQKALNGLQLPQAVQIKLATLFSNIEKNAEKASQAMVNGFKTKGDVTKYEQATNQIVHDMQTLVQVMDRIDPSKLNFEINGDKAKQLTEEIKNIKNAINTISTETLNELKQTIGEPPSKAKAWNDFFDAISRGADGVDDAEKALNRLETQVKKAEEAGRSMAKDTPWGDYKEKVEELRKVLDALQAQIEYLNQKEQERAGLQGEANDEGVKGYNDLQNAARGAADGAGQLAENEQKVAKETENVNSEVEQFKSKITYFFGMANAVQLFRRALSAAFETVKELDKVMTQTAVVTNFSVGDMWSQLPEYTKRANELGVSIKGVYEAATLYYQQGLKTNEVMELTNETLKMARIAGLDAATATDRMTNALRGFNMEINETNAQRVNDVYSKLAAITASNTDEISTAMTKVASLANNANMSFETTAAFLSQIIETTRESAETAGTALKTIIARFSEVKKLYSEGSLLGTDEEGNEVDVNKVSQALRVAGINLNEYLTGSKDLGQIFIELASKWDSLDKVTQRYIATMAAGSRQQSRFIAMMSDYSRTTQLVNAANTAAGASQEQFNKTLESMESKLERLKNAWDSFTMSIANPEMLKTAVDLLENLLSGINKVTDGLGKFSGISKIFLTVGLFKLGKALAQKFFNSISSILKGEATKSGQLTAEQWVKAFGAGVKRTRGQSLLDKIFPMRVTKQYGQELGKELRNSIQSAVPAEKISKLITIFETQGYDAFEEALKKGGYLTEDLNNKLKTLSEETKKYKGTLQDWQKGLDNASSACFALGTAFGFIAQLLEETGESGKEAAEVFSTMGTVLTGIGSGISAIGQLIPVVASIAKAAGIEVGVAWAWVAGIAAVLAGLVYLVISAYNEIQNAKPEKQLAKAQEAAKQAGEAADDAASKYDNLKQSLEDITDQSNSLDNLTKGTKEWKDAVYKLNLQVLELAKTYKNLNYEVDENGVYRITNMEQVLEEAFKSKAGAAALSIGAQIRVEDKRADYEHSVDKEDKNYEQIEQNKRNTIDTLYSQLVENALAIENISSESRDVFRNLYTFSRQTYVDFMDEARKNVEAMTLTDKQTLYALQLGTTWEELVKEQKDVSEYYLNAQLEGLKLQELITEGLQKNQSTVATLSKENKKLLSREGRDLTLKDLKTFFGNQDLDKLTKQAIRNYAYSAWGQDEELKALFPNYEEFIKLMEQLHTIGLDTTKKTTQYIGELGDEAKTLVEDLSTGSINNISKVLQNMLWTAGQEATIGVVTALGEIKNSFGEDANKIEKFFSAFAQVGNSTNIDAIKKLSDNLIALGVITSDMVPTIDNLENLIINVNNAVPSTSSEDLKSSLQDMQQLYYDALSGKDGVGSFTETQMKQFIEDTVAEESDFVYNYATQKWDYLGDGSELIVRSIQKQTADLSRVILQKDINEIAKKLDDSPSILRKSIISGTTDQTEWYINIRGEERVFTSYSDALKNTTITNGSGYYTTPVKSRIIEVPIYSDVYDEFTTSMVMADYLSSLYQEIENAGYDTRDFFTLESIATLFNYGLSQEEAETLSSIFQKTKENLFSFYSSEIPLLDDTSSGELQAKKAWELAQSATFGEKPNKEGAAMLAISNALGIRSIFDKYAKNDVDTLADIIEAYRSAAKLDIKNEDLEDEYNTIKLLNPQLADNLAYWQALNKLRLNTGYKSFVDAFTKSKDALVDTTNMAATSDAIKTMNQAFKDLTGTTVKFNKEWYTSAKNIDLMQRAAEGDADAISQLNLEAAIALGGKDSRESLTELWEYLGRTGDFTDEAENMVRIISQELKDNPELQTIFSLLGLTLDFGADNTWEGTGFYRSIADTINLANASTQSTRDVFTELDQINQQINDTLRERNKLEHEYQKLLKQSGTSLADTQAALQKQVDTYYKEQEYQQQVIDYNKDQYQKLREKYGSNITRYATLNKSDYSIDIFNGWKKLSDSQQEEFKKYFTELTNLQKAIHSAVDSIDSAEDAIDDLREQQEEAYLSLEDRVLNALISKREKEIDAIEELGNSIDNANSKIISNLQQQVQLQRQARDNAKTEQSINDKEARLAFLRRDTSGANALEIMKLEKEIEEERQSYSDTLVDQAIDEMQREADKAAEQRQTQIQIMRDQLEMQKENGELWGEVHYLIDSAINPDGTLNNNSALVGLLMDEDGYKGLSERGQLQWLRNLQGQILDALTTMNGDSSYSDRFSTEGYRILNRHAEGGAKDDTDKEVLDRLYVLYKQSNSKRTFLDWINGLGSRRFEQWELTLAGYASGGLADFTGPAWLDGTRSKPEMVLSPTDTQNFLMLRDILARAYAPNGTSAASGDFYFDIDINAELGSDYDVDQLAEQLERKITESAEYRNVNTMNYLR